MVYEIIPIQLGSIILYIQQITGVLVTAQLILVNNINYLDVPGT